MKEISLETRVAVNVLKKNIFVSSFYVSLVHTGDGEIENSDIINRIIKGKVWYMISLLYFENISIETLLHEERNFFERSTMVNRERKRLSNRLARLNIKRSLLTLMTRSMARHRISYANSNVELDSTLYKQLLK